MVSNGREVVLTGPDGGWTLPVEPGDCVFVIKPPDWGTPTTSAGVPLFSYLQGWTAVWVFFAISGYLVTMLLIREERKNGTIAYGPCLITRSFRIVPGYAAARTEPRARRQVEEEARARLRLPEENLLYFCEKHSPRLAEWERSILVRPVDGRLAVVPGIAVDAAFAERSSDTWHVAFDAVVATQAV